MKLDTTMHTSGVELEESDYARETLIVRSRKFAIELEDIEPKHSRFIEETARYCGAKHYVAEREDGTIFHKIDINAAGVINWCREVLCPTIPRDLQEVMANIFQSIAEKDPLLGSYMVPDCVYRNGICTREKPCGKSLQVLKHLVALVPEKIYRDARNEALVAAVSTGKETIH